MNNAVRYRGLWITYLVFSVAATLIALVLGLDSALNERGLLQEMVGCLISLLYVVPLYGYIQQKPIPPRWLWWTLLIVTGTAMLALLSFALLAAFSERSPLPVFIWAAIVTLLIPNLFAIQQYVRSRHIWNAT
jgi:hypothetical protein